MKRLSPRIGLWLMTLFFAGALSPFLTAQTPAPLVQIVNAPLNYESAEIKRNHQFWNTGYVTVGTVENNGVKSGMIIAYNEDMTIAWQRQFSNPISGANIEFTAVDILRVVNVEPPRSGYVITGYIDGGLDPQTGKGTNRNILVLHVDRGGNLIWKAAFDSPYTSGGEVFTDYDDVGLDIAVEGSQVFVTGYCNRTTTTCAVDNQTRVVADLFLLRGSHNGTAWSTAFLHDPNAPTYPQSTRYTAGHGLVAAGSGTVLVTGETRYGGMSEACVTGSPIDSDSELLVARFGTDLSLKWVHHLVRDPFVGLESANSRGNAIIRMNTQPNTLPRFAITGDVNDIPTGGGGGSVPSVYNDYMYLMTFTLDLANPLAMPMLPVYHKYDIAAVECMQGLDWGAGAEDLVQSSNDDFLLAGWRWTCNGTGTNIFNDRNAIVLRTDANGQNPHAHRFNVDDNDAFHGLTNGYDGLNGVMVGVTSGIARHAGLHVVDRGADDLYLSCGDENSVDEIEESPILHPDPWFVDHLAPVPLEPVITTPEYTFEQTCGPEEPEECEIEIGGDYQRFDRSGTREEGYDIIATTFGGAAVGKSYKEVSSSTFYDDLHLQVFDLDGSTTGSSGWMKRYHYGVSNSFNARGFALTRYNTDYFVAGEVEIPEGGPGTTPEINGLFFQTDQNGALLKAVALGRSSTTESYLESLNAIIPSSGGYTLAGHSTGIYNSDANFPQGTNGYVVALDQNGDLLPFTPGRWANIYGGDGEEEFYDIIQQSDGSYIAIGYIADPNNGSSDDGLICKINADGTIAWTKILTSVDDERLYKIIPDGTGYVIVGTAANWVSGASYGILAKVDFATGSISWVRKYDVAGSTNDWLRDVKAWSTGISSGFILAGSTETANDARQGWLIKVDANGNAVRDLTAPDANLGGTPGSSNEDWFNAVAVNTLGSFLMTGKIASYDQVPPTYSDFWNAKALCDLTMCGSTTSPSGNSDVTSSFTLDNVPNLIVKAVPDYQDITMNWSVPLDGESRKIPPCEGENSNSGNGVELTSR